MADFLDHLQHQGLLQPEQVAAVRSRIRRTNMPLEQSLQELKLLPEEKLYGQLAAFYDLPLCDLTTATPSPELIAKVPARLAERFGCLPVSLNQGTLLLAFTSVPPQSTLDQLKLLLGTRLQIALCQPSHFTAWQRQVYGIAADNVRLVRSHRKHDAGKENDFTVEVAGDSHDDGSIIQIVNEILDQAIATRATDVHVEPYRDTLRIRFRVDGMLRDIPAPPGLAELADPIIARIKVMAQLDITERRLPHDGRIRLMRHGVPCNIRASILPTRFGESLCLRLLDSAQRCFQTSELGLTSTQLSLLHEIIQRPNGMVLVTGPTGSGKTTTLYSILGFLRDKRPELKIITVEDPVEYEMAGLTQIQTHAEIGLTFATALRSILRHDPDIILVGEIRDRETAEIAIQSALTGHLVFSTLHTNDSVGAVSRLVNIGVEPDLVAASLTCVIAQRLVRKLCPQCAEPLDALPPKEMTEMLAALSHNKLNSNELNLKRPHPGGCAHCGHTGYFGRTAIYEFLPIAEHLEDLICQKAPNSELRHAALASGLKTFREDGWLKVADGITTADEINRVTLPPK